MTKKRYLICAGSFAVCVVLALTLGTIALLPPSPGVTKANFDRLENGMTKENVSELLGSRNVTGPWMMRVGPPHRYFCWWAEDGARANVFFDDDRVILKWWFPSDETFLTKLRRLVHLD